MSQLLQNVPTSTSFQFSTPVYKQRGGVVMGDPLCASMCSFLIEDLQKKSNCICRPSTWTRHLEDILEEIKQGHRTDWGPPYPGPVQVTHKEETDGSISYLDINKQGQQDKDENLRSAVHVCMDRRTSPNCQQ